MLSFPLDLNQPPFDSAGELGGQFDLGIPSSRKNRKEKQLARKHSQLLSKTIHAEPSTPPRIKKQKKDDKNNNKVEEMKVELVVQKAKPAGQKVEPIVQNAEPVVQKVEP